MRDGPMHLADRRRRDGNVVPPAKTMSGWPPIPPRRPGGKLWLIVRSRPAGAGERARESGWARSRRRSSYLPELHQRALHVPERGDDLLGGAEFELGRAPRGAPRGEPPTGAVGGPVPPTSIRAWPTPGSGPGAPNADDLATTKPMTAAPATAEYPDSSPLSQCVTASSGNRGAGLSRCPWLTRSGSVRPASLSLSRMRGGRPPPAHWAGAVWSTLARGRGGERRA